MAIQLFFKYAHCFIFRWSMRLSVERQAVDVINFTTGSNVKYPERKGAMDVCLAIQEMREESEIIGAIRFNKKRGISQDETKQYIIEEYQKDAKEADELIQTYWK